MPRLVLFAPCSRVIISADDDTASLVGLLDGIRSQLSPDGAAASVADVTWEHFALWVAEPGDGDQQFEQRVEVVGPDRRVAAEVRQEFAMSARSLRVRGAVSGFPTAQAGDYTVRLSLRSVLDGDTWVRVADYPVLVSHDQGEAPPE